MSFYSLSKEERINLVKKINEDILAGIRRNNVTCIVRYFSDDDTYIRKSAYLATGKIYSTAPDLQDKVIISLQKLLAAHDFKVRQTAINSAGEIGIKNFEVVQYFFDQGVHDSHHSVRNAVIGSVKKMANKNPVPVLAWAAKYLHHPDKEIRREICHGIELRGRTHPQDILPLLKELQHDKSARVLNTLVHVLGQISYKKNCLVAVVYSLNMWENKVLASEAIAEIIDVHHRYRNFSVLTQQQAIDYINVHYRNKAR